MWRARISSGLARRIAPASLFLDQIANGDAYYEYSNGVPLQIIAYNTPDLFEPAPERGFGCVRHGYLAA